jgi:Fe-S cluster assembly iron-binding protein IscA
MALDEPLEEDQAFSDRDIKFIIDKKLFEEVKPIRVDFVESATGSGFKLTSNLAAGAGCGDTCCD